MQIRINLIFYVSVTQDQLSKVLFPIGALQKEKVRKIAAQQDLVTANKKDSQGLCFIGKVSLPDFLQQQLKAKTGNIFDIPEHHIAYQNPQTNFASQLDMLMYNSTKKHITLQTVSLLAVIKGRTFLQRDSAKD